MAAFLIAISVAAAISIGMRWQFIGTLSDGHMQCLTASTTKFAQNWLNEGMWNYKGLMLELPLSIEPPHLGDRDIYPSYPSGATMEIFVLQKFFPHAGLIPLIHLFNFFNHFFYKLSGSCQNK